MSRVCNGNGILAPLSTSVSLWGAGKWEMSNLNIHCCPVEATCSIPIPGLQVLPGLPSGWALPGHRYRTSPQLWRELTTWSLRQLRVHLSTGRASGILVSTQTILDDPVWGRLGSSTGTRRPQACPKVCAFVRSRGHGHLWWMLSPVWFVPPPVLVTASIKHREKEPVLPFRLQKAENLAIPELGAPQFPLFSPKEKLEIKGCTYLIFLQRELDLKAADPLHMMPKKRTFTRFFTPLPPISSWKGGNLTP